MFNRHPQEPTPTVAEVTAPSLTAEVATAPAETVTTAPAARVPMTSSEYLQARHTLIAEGRLTADLDAFVRAASARADLSAIVAAERAVAPFKVEPGISADPLRHGRDRGDINRTRRTPEETEMDRRRKADATARSLALLKHDKARGVGYSATGATSELDALEAAR